MIPRILFLAAVALAATFTGCGARQSTPPEEDTDKVELFKAGKGVRLDEDTKHLLGVELVEVMEKPLAREFKRGAQVFQVMNGSALATFLVDAAETNGIAGKSVAVTANSSRTTGSVLRIEGIAHALLGQAEAIIEFANAPNSVTVGTHVEVRITADEKAVFVVPRAALLSAADGDYVYVANGTHLTRTKVKTGASFDGLIGIEDGLYAGDQVAATAVSNVWFVELSALKGGTPCCVKPKK
jgi:hypothetical protein